MTVLVVLDIDGTLLQTVALHQKSYREALQSSALSDDLDLNGFLHHTDSWIFYEVFRRDRGRAPQRRRPALRLLARRLSEEAPQLVEPQHAPQSMFDPA